MFPRWENYFQVSNTKIFWKFYIFQDESSTLPQGTETDCINTIGVNFFLLQLLFACNLAFYFNMAKKILKDLV